MPRSRLASLASLPLATALLAPLLLASCLSLREPLEAAQVPASTSGWIIGSLREDSGTGTLIEYVPEDESIDAWSKLVTVQFLEGRRTPLDEQVRELERAMRRRCPERVEWTVLEEGRDSVLYEWRIRDCPPADDQHELARLMRGNDGTHRVAYCEKSAAIDATTREDWLAKLRSTRLVKGPEMAPVVLED
jgi:hypothetical protein